MKKIIITYRYEHFYKIILIIICLVIWEIKFFFLMESKQYWQRLSGMVPGIKY